MIAPYSCLLRAATLLTLAARLSLAQQPVTQLAFKEYLAQNAHSAVTLFRSAVRQRPSDASLHAWLAEAALRSGNTADALQPADDALRLDPCNAPGHLVRAAVITTRFALR